MKIPRQTITLLLVFGLLAVSNPLWAEKRMSTEQRLERLERLQRNQNMAQLVYQIQQLQQEIQRLNGELEMQKHAMDAMNKRQRDLYLDIDQRLSRLQPGSGSRVSPSTGVKPPAMPAPRVATTPPAPAPAMPGVPVTPPDPKKEAQAYQSAFNLLKQGRYPESIKAFSAF